jgi:hypothetical protein
MWETMVHYWFVCLFIKQWIEDMRDIYCELELWKIHTVLFVKVTNKMQMYRLIYYSKSALHVLGDVFAHHQEHLTVFTVSGSVYPRCCHVVQFQLIQDTSRQQLGWTLPDTVNTVRCSGWWGKIKKIQFLPYGRSIGSWIHLTHKTYIRKIE